MILNIFLSLEHGGVQRLKPGQRKCKCVFIWLSLYYKLFCQTNLSKCKGKKKCSFAISIRCFRTHSGPKHCEQQAGSIWGPEKSDGYQGRIAVPGPPAKVQPLEAGAV